ncbi:Hypp5455 [Branchiostoma lanceolatum]|uniref:Hypp5455 protein n=1 Tax=Branchiostoma lanceolatum TaxID=7740 RepID=A0A8J9VEE3_BRALA|nr:Hypp5455 [Branchiostoma lanceolatum]
MLWSTRIFLGCCVVGLLVFHNAAAQVVVTKSSVYPNPDTLLEGESLYYDVQLSAAPSSTAKVTFTVTNTTRITASPTEVDFTGSDWDVARRVELAAPEDGVVESAVGTGTFPVEVWYQEGGNAGTLAATLQIALQDNDYEQYIRHGAISWTRDVTSGRSVAVFHISLSYHTSLQPDVTSGDVISVPVTLNFNDGSQSTNTLDVTVVEVSSFGYILTSAEVTHDFGSSSAASWEVTLSQCCRSNELLNNGGTTTTLQTTVDFTAGSAPHLATLPVVHWYKRHTSEFYLPAVSASGTPVVFSLASPSDYGSGQAGPPPGLQLDGAAGRVTWDAEELQSGLWSALVVVQDSVTGVKAMQELIFHLHDIATDAHPPLVQPFDAVATAVRYVSADEVFSQDGVITDQDVGNLLSMRWTAGAPDGWTLTKTSESSGTSVTVEFQLQWTPGSDDVGSHVICVQAVDSDLVESVPQCLQVVVFSGTLSQLTLSAANTTLNLTNSDAQTVSLDAAGFSITTSSSVQSMTVSLLYALDTGEERLTYSSTSTSSVSVSYYTDNTVVYVTGTAQSTTYESVLNGISYSNSAARPTEGTRLVTVRACTEDRCDFHRVDIAVTPEGSPPSVSVGVSGSGLCPVTFDTEAGPVNIVASNTAAAVTNSGGLISSMSVTLHNATDGSVESLAVSYTPTEQLPLPVVVESAELNTPVGTNSVQKVSHTLTVSESNQTVGHIVVIVDIKHSWIGDLKLELEHEGVTETLTLRPGGYACSQYHISPAVFFGTAGYTDIDSTDGELPSLSKSGTEPGVCRYESHGSFKPDGDFSAFVGTASSGDWTLHVTDLVSSSGDGRLVRWALVIHPTSDGTVALDGLLPPLAASLDQSTSPIQNEMLLNQGGRVREVSVAVQMVISPVNGSDVTPSVLVYHPDGTAVALMEETAGCNLSSVAYFVFHDSGTPSGDICVNGNTDLASVLKPSTSLSTLAGKAVNGEWRLVVDANVTVAIEMFSWSLHVAAEPNSDWSYDAATNQLTITGTDTAEWYVEVLNAVTYDNSAASPDATALRYVTVDVTNSDGLHGNDVTCLEVRHKPVVDLNGADLGTDLAVTYTEDGGPVSIVSQDATLAGSDSSSDIVYIIAEITNRADGDLEVLSVQNLTRVEHVTVLGQTVSVDVITAPVVHFTSGQLNISGLSSTEEYLQVLLTLTYNNEAEEPSSSQRVIHVTANDGARESDVTTVTISVTRVNDAPHFNTNPLPSLSTQEDANKYTQVPITVLQFIGIGSDSIISDNDAGATQGIAIIGADNTNGQWDFLAWPGAYTEIADGERQSDGTVNRNSTLSALSVVLKAEYFNFLRFIPDPNFSGESTISFVAWDLSGSTSSLSNGDFVNATYTGNTGPFSEEHVTVTLTVQSSNDAPTVDASQVVTFSPVDEDVTDPAGDVITVLVSNCDDVDLTWPGTQQNIGVAVTGVDNSNGVWEYSTDNGTTWSVLGSVSSSSAVLLGEDGDNGRYRLRFLPEPDFSGTAFLYYRAWDFSTGTAGDTGVSATYTSSTGAFSQSEAIASITVQPSNDSPLVTDGITMATITEDVTSDDNLGTSVAAMLAGHYTDKDTGNDVGVAVVTVDETYGDWQYTCDSAQPYDWSDFVGGYHLGYVVPPLPILTSATLLKSSCRMRFLPQANLNTDNMATAPYVTILGWDNTETGLTSAMTYGVDVTGYADSEQNEFGSDMKNVTIQVTAVNDPPELQLASGAVEAVFPEHGDPVTLVGDGYSLTDVDDTDLVRATVSIDGEALNNCSESSASVEEVTVNLDSMNLTKNILSVCPFQMTIIPNDSIADYVTLEEFRAALSTLSYANSYTNPNLLSRTISVTVFDGDDVSQTASAHVIIQVTNDAPVLTNVTKFESIAEDVQDGDNNGTTVLALVDGIYTDSDVGSDVGIAVVGADTRYGAWQWCCQCDNATWQDMIGGMYYGFIVPPDPLPEKATLLSASCRIRFLPDADFNTELDSQGSSRDLSDRPYLTIKAWDNTGTTAGMTAQFGVDSTACSNVYTCEFSAEAVNATIDVLSVNDPPEITLPAGYSLDFVEDGDPVALLPDGFSVLDKDGVVLKKVTITLQNSTGDEGFLLNATSVENVTISGNLATISETTVEHIAFNGTSELTLQAPVNLSAVSITSYVTLLRSVMYYNNQPEPDNFTRDVRICTDDGLNTTCESFFISIQLLGDNAPILIVSSYNFTFIEDGDEVFVVDPENLTLSDADNNEYFLMAEAVVTVQSLSPDLETLSVNTNNTSLSSDFNAASGTLTITGQASVQTYQEVLRTVKYKHSGAEPQPGPRTITYYVIDTDGLKSNVVVASVDVDVINDCVPVLNASGSFLFTEGQDSPTSIGQNVSLTDCDSGNFPMESVVVWIDPAFDGTSESLSVTSSEGITSTYLPDDATLRLSGPASLSTFQSALETLVYANNAEEPTPTTRHVYMYASDGLHNSSVASVTIEITLVNDPPVIDLNGDVTTGSDVIAVYTEGSGDMTFADSLSLTDNDNNLLAYANITLVNNPDYRYETVTVDTLSTSLTAIYVDANHSSIYLSGQDTVENYAEVLRTVSYSNIHGDPDPQQRVVEFTVSDGNAESDKGTAYIIFETQNDAPTLSSATTDVSFTEEGSPVYVSPGVTVSDVDSSILASATVTITNHIDQVWETLNVSTSESLFAVFDVTSGVFHISGVASVEEYQTTLQTVTYQNTKDEPSTDARVLAFSCSDGITESIALNITVNITAVNDPPSIVLSNGTTTYSGLFIEDFLPSPIVDSNVTVLDEDSPFLSEVFINVTNVTEEGFEGVFLDLSYLSDSETFDQTQYNQILLYNSTQCTTDSVHSSIQLQGAFTPAQAKELLLVTRYCTAHDNPTEGERVINIIVTDDQGEPSPLTTAVVTVRRVNDPPRPVTEPLTTSFTALEDNDLTITAFSLFYDPEENLTTSAVNVMSYPTNGDLVVTNEGDLQYTPVMHDFGQYDLTYRVCDSENACTETYSLTIDIVSVNDPPEPVLPLTITTQEDTPVSTDLKTFVQDVEDDANEDSSYPSVSITSYPTSGVAEFSADYRIMNFTPAANYHGEEQVGVRFCDSDGACIENTIAITVTSVNDPPTLTVTNGQDQADPIQTKEDVSVTVQIVVSDVEQRTPFSIITNDTTHGTAIHNTTALVETLTEDSGNPFNALYTVSTHITYSPAADYVGEDRVVFYTCDSEGKCAQGVIYIQISSENDPPQVGSTTVYTEEDTPLVIKLPDGLNISDAEDALDSSDVDVTRNVSLGILTYDVDGDLVYTPPVHFYSTNPDDVTFDIRVCDRDVNQLCTEAQIQISVSSVNDAPVAPPQYVELNEDTTLTVDLGAVLTDTEDANGTAAVSLTEPRPTLVTASYDNQAGLVTIVAGTDRSGKDLIHYQACDSSGLCNLDGMIVVTILEVNDPPAVDPFDFHASEDVTSVISVGDHYSDLETSELSSLNLRLVDPVSGAYETEATSQRGGELEAISSAGLVQYKPLPGYVGDDSFAYVVCDPCDQREAALTGGYVSGIPSCQRQLEMNQGSEYDVTGTHIACSVATVTVYVMNTNDAPDVSAFHVVTSRYEVASINPIGTHQNDAYTTADMSIFDPDDVQAQELLNNGMNLTFYQMIDTTDLNVTTLAITSQPTKGTAVVDRSSAVPAIKFTPRQNESGYDSFYFQVCDKDTQYKSSQCGGNVIQVMVTAPSPYIVNVTAFPGTDGGDVIHADSKYSSGDSLRVVFNEDTNMPPYGQAGSTITASDLHKMFTFSTNLTVASNSEAFTGVWLNPRELEITVIDVGYPQIEPKVGEWTASVNPVAPCGGFDEETHAALPEDRWSPYCLLNAVKDSAHANGTSPPLVGNWGLRIPSLTTIVVRNDQVDISVLRDQPAYFGQGSQLVLSLQPALSHQQLQLFCQQDVQNIVTMETFGPGTSMLKTSCVNRDSGEQVASVRRRNVRGQGRVARDTQVTNMPEFTELVLQIEEPYSGNLSVVPEDAFAKTVQGALNKDSLARVLATSSGVETQDFLDYTASVEDSFSDPSLYLEQLDGKTPQVLSVVADDADNGDSHWSNGDTLTITFDVETDTPPVATETEISRIMTFNPPLGTSYTGQWVTTSVLVITVQDTSHPVSDVDNMANVTFAFTENVLVTGQEFATQYQYGVPSDKPNCVGTHVCGWNASSGSVGICSADQLSCRARGAHGLTSGDFGRPDNSLDWWYYVIICTATLLTCCTLGIIVYLRQRKRAKSGPGPPKERRIHRVTRLLKKRQTITGTDKAASQGGVATPQTTTLNSVLVNSRHAPVPVDNIMQRNNLRDDPRQPKELHVVSQPAPSLQNSSNVNRNNVNGASTTNKLRDDVRQTSARHVVSEPSQPFLLSQTSQPLLASQPTPSMLGSSVNSASSTNDLNQSTISPSRKNYTNATPQHQSLLYETTGEESDPNVPGPITPAAGLAVHQVVERSTNIDMSTERRRRSIRRKPGSQIPRISELAGPLEGPSPEPAAPPPADDPEVGPLLKRSSSNSIYSLTTVNLGFEAEERRPGSSSSESVGPRSFLTTDAETGLAIRTHVYPRMDSDQSLQSNGSGGGGRRPVSKKHKRVAPVSATTPYKTRTPTLGTGALKPRPVTPDSSRPSSSSSNSSPAPQLRRLAVAARLLHSNRMGTAASSEA